MFILGLNAFEICSSVAFIENGIIKFAACEERFSRIKRDRSFPFKSLKAGLEELDIKISDLDAIAIGWNPAVESFKYNGALPSRPREIYYYKLIEAFMSQLNHEDDDFDWSSVRTSGDSLPEIFLVRHHLAHASNSIFQSKFDNGDFLTLDFMGERETGIYGKFENNKIIKLNVSKQPCSTGAFYAAITQMLGYKYDSDEWKVMALSAHNELSEKSKEYIKVFEQATAFGGISPLLKNEFFNTDQQREKFLTTSKLREMLDCPNSIDKRDSLEIRSWQMNVAAAMQKFISDYTFKAIEEISEKHNSKRENICLSGGFFMNCVFNGELEKSNLYKNVFISQSPADLGNSIGSAMYVEHVIFKNKKNNYQQKLFTGAKAEVNISEKLDKYQINYKKYPDINTLVKDIVSYLLKNKILAIYNGNSEFGERALGARSIISLANKSENKSLINNKIKYREDYRPFAPVCLQNNAHKFFEVDKNYQCNSMEKVVRIRKEYLDKLPAIAHFDNTARLQTIDENSNLLIAKVLIYLEKNSYIPVLINTSFNLNGEPNVENVDDAIRTFFTSGLDYLVLENNIISK